MYCIQEGLGEATGVVCTAVYHFPSLVSRTVRPNAGSESLHTIVGSIFFFHYPLVTPNIL